MLVEIPPKMSISSFSEFLKGKSSLMILEKFANLKYKYENRHFWCRGFYVDLSEKIRMQLKTIQEQENMIAD